MFSRRPMTSTCFPNLGDRNITDHVDPLSGKRAIDIPHPVAQTDANGRIISPIYSLEELADWYYTTEFYPEPMSDLKINWKRIEAVLWGKDNETGEDKISQPVDIHKERETDALLQSYKARFAQGRPNTARIDQFLHENPHFRLPQSSSPSEPIWSTVTGPYY